MKKLIPAYLLLAVTALLTTSCTQNGGHIGALFGRWHLVRIEADNMEAPPTPPGDIFWAFQGDMFEMQLAYTDVPHAVSTTYGLYTLTDDDKVLTLTFPEERYAPFAETGLGRENRLDVLRLTYGEMTVVYHPSADASLTYYLRKW